jgi:VanZ family protein
VPKLRAFLKYWLPPLVWMALVFTGSSDAKSYQHSSLLVEPILRWLFPHLSQAHVEEIHHLIRKCGHLTEYAVLALLFWRAIRQSDRKNLRPLVAPERSEGGWNWPEARLALLLVMFYAATDEFHQSFVPTRTSLVSDVLIDTCGGASGLIALWIFGRLRKRW